jgi:hypothetical protein
MLSCDVIIWDDNTPLFYFSWKLYSLLSIVEDPHLRVMIRKYIYRNVFSTLLLYYGASRVFNLLVVCGEIRQTSDAKRRQLFGSLQYHPFIIVFPLRVTDRCFAYFGQQKVRDTVNSSDRK